MANSRDELIQMPAERGNLPEEEMTKLLAGISDETEKDGVDSESAVLFVKMLEEEEEKKKRGAEKVCEEITAFFVANEWMYSEVTQSKYPLYVLNIKMRNLNVSLMVLVNIEEECIRFDTVLPVTCKNQNHIILSYKLTNINMSLPYGAFHLDTNENEISYRYTLPYSPETFKGHVSGIIIEAIAGIVNKYYETVVSYAQGRLPDEEEKNEVLKAIQRNVEYLKKNS